MCRIGNFSLYSLSKHLRHGPRDVPVHDDLPLARLAVEVDVGHRHEPQVRERDRAAGPPLTVLEVRLQRLRQRSDRRLDLVKRDERERDGEEAEHRPD